MCLSPDFINYKQLKLLFSKRNYDDPRLNINLHFQIPYSVFFFFHVTIETAYYHRQLIELNIYIQKQIFIEITLLLMLLMFIYLLYPTATLRVLECTANRLHFFFKCLCNYLFYYFIYYNIKC